MKALVYPHPIHTRLSPHLARRSPVPLVAPPVSSYIFLFLSSLIPLIHVSLAPDGPAILTLTLALTRQVPVVFAAAIAIYGLITGIRTFSLSLSFSLFCFLSAFLSLSLSLSLSSRSPRISPFRPVLDCSLSLLSLSRSLLSRPLSPSLCPSLSLSFSSDNSEHTRRLLPAC